MCCYRLQKRLFSFVLILIYRVHLRLFGRTCRNKRKTAFKARCLLGRVNPRLCGFGANLGACMDEKSVLWYTIGVRILSVKKIANIIFGLKASAFR